MALTVAANHSSRLAEPMERVTGGAPIFVAWGQLFIRVGDRYIVRRATAAERLAYTFKPTEAEPRAKAS